MTDKLPLSKRHPLAHIAPYPTSLEEVTAAALVMHYTTFGLMHDRLATNFVFSGEDTQWRESADCVVSSFTVAYLLVELEDKAGLMSADAAAQEMWSALEAGDALTRWLRQTAGEFGLDMAAIERAADQVEKNIRAKAAAASPWVHPDQTTIPAGGES